MADQDHIVLARERIAELQQQLRDPERNLSASERQLFDLEIQRLRMLLGPRQTAGHWEGSRFAWVCLLVGMVLGYGSMEMLPHNTLGQAIIRWVVVSAGMGLCMYAWCVLIFSNLGPGSEASPQSTGPVVGGEREGRRGQAPMSSRKQPASPGWLAWVSAIFAAALLAGGLWVLWLPGTRGLEGLDFCLRIPLGLMMFLVGLVWMIGALESLTGASGWRLRLGVLFLVGLLGAFVVFAFSRS
jgi:hypothetical protein